MEHQDSVRVADTFATAYEWKGGDESEGAYYLYYNQAFAGGRGISIITPSGQIDDLREIGDRLQEAAGLSIEDGSKLRFHMEDNPDGGEKAVAEEPLVRGRLVMARTPVLLIHNGFMEHFDTSPVAHPRDVAVHSRVCSQHLSDEKGKEYYGFSGCKRLYSVERQQRLLKLAVESLPPATAQLFQAQLPEDGSISNNISMSGFRVDLKGHYYIGAYPEAAGLAHHCRPNAAYYIDPQTLMHRTTVARSIQPGEELTIARLFDSASEALMQSRDQRQKLAQSVWGRGCTCSQCSLPPSETATSDKQMEGIGWSLYMAISIYGELGRGGKVSETDLVNEMPFAEILANMIKMAEDEKLDCAMATVYHWAALYYNLVGEVELAAKYAGLTIEALEIENGMEDEQIQEIARLRANLKGHSSFKMRGEA